MGCASSRDLLALEASMRQQHDEQMSALKELLRRAGVNDTLPGYSITPSLHPIASPTANTGVAADLPAQRSEPAITGGGASPTIHGRIDAEDSSLRISHPKLSAVLNLPIAQHDRLTGESPPRSTTDVAAYFTDVIDTDRADTEELHNNIRSGRITPSALPALIETHEGSDSEEASQAKKKPSPPRLVNLQPVRPYENPNRAILTSI